MEGGNECFCWYDDDSYNREGKLEDMVCDTPCEGDVENTCGGLGALEVFNIVELALGDGASAEK